MAVLGLRFCARAFSSCGKWGPLFIAARRPLTIAASLVAEHRLQTRRLSNCGSRAQLLHGMWDPPGPELKPVPPALAGRFPTTAPPGKPPTLFIFNIYLFICLFWLLWVLVAACRIYSCSMRTLSCGMHVGSNSPPGIEPGPPALGAWSLTHWTTREVPVQTALKEIIRLLFCFLIIYQDHLLAE